MAESPPDSETEHMKVFGFMDRDLENRNKDREKRHIFRSKAIDEIVSSEENYLKTLSLTEKYFMQPLQENGLITTKLHKVLFGKFENIRGVNEELLKLLRENRENVGKAFVNLAPYFKHYSVYANNFKPAVLLVQKLEKDDKLFAKFLGNQERRPEVGMKLMSLLITPIQRIPRYKLLLEQVLQFTEKESEDYGHLTEAISKIATVATHINDCISEHENMQMLLNVQKCLYGGKPRIVIPGRRLIKQGPLGKVSPKGDGAKQRMYLLFNDMFMCCKLRGTDPAKPQSLICSCILPINHCVVKCLLGDGKCEGCLFKITCKEETMILCSNSKDEGLAWIEALQSAIKQYEACRRTLRRESSGKRPLKRPAIVKEKIQSLSQLNRQRHSEAGGNADRDALFPLRELQRARDCIMTPLKRLKTNSQQESEMASGQENNATIPVKYNDDTSSLESLEVDNDSEMAPLATIEQRDQNCQNPNNVLLSLDEVIHMAPHSVASLTGLIAKMSEPAASGDQARNSCVLF